VNLSDEDYIIKSGERICQMIISRHENIKLVQVESISLTQRGEGGFGHTGKN
jgi:dUTP pyrophosphatase